MLLLRRVIITGTVTCTGTNSKDVACDTIMTGVLTNYLVDTFNDN